MSVKLSAVLLAAACLAVAGPAMPAENWQEYRFNKAGFSAHFPGRPKISDKAYVSSQAASGRRLTERVYASNEGGVIYSVRIVDFSNPAADPDAAVDEVTDSLTAFGELVF